MIITASMKNFHKSTKSDSNSDVKKEKITDLLKKVAESFENYYILLEILYLLTKNTKSVII